MFKYALLLSVVAVLLVVFFPRSYDVPQPTRLTGILYWHLKTGSTIAYTKLEAKGIKKPYPIIFLQGGPGGFISERTINMLAPLTEDGFTIYLYDQIGSGASARLSNIKEYTATRHKKDLEEIVKQLGVEKVILLGQSWGAMLAMLYVADNVNNVERIILTGSGPILPIHKELANTQAPDSLQLRKPIYTNRQANEKMENIRIKAIKYCATTWGKKLASDKEVDAFQTALNTELNKAIVCDTSKARKALGGGGFYVHVMTVNSFGETPDIRPKLKGNTVPILLMKGQCDNQPWGYTHEYVDLFPNHQLKIIPNSGHSISVEQPEFYIKTIRAFLNE